MVKAAVVALATLGAALGAWRLGPLVAPAAAEEAEPIRVEMGEARGPVGRPTEILAKLTIKPGYRFIDPPPRGNRLMQLSSADDGVTFARRVFRGSLNGDAITFRLEVTPTSPGPHPINGVFRVSYVADNGESWHLRHVSLPMMTIVTGTQ